jgi:hypothetical protein
MTDVEVQDWATRVTPIGARFFDAVEQAVVSEGLVVSMWRLNGSPKRQKAIVNHTGVFVMRNLRCLYEAESGNGDKDYWDHVSTKPYGLEMTDSKGRFLPYWFEVEAPTRGFVGITCGSPSPSTESGLLLYSAPSRSVAGHYATVRADLWDVQHDCPASWAYAELTANHILLCEGMADRNGKLGMFFAYPEAVDQFPASPLRTGISPRDQSWDIQLTIKYRLKDPIPDIPNLCDEVLGQPQVQVWQQTGPNLELTTAILRVGQELILKTVGKSELLIG